MFYRILILIQLIALFSFTACDDYKGRKSKANSKQTPDIVLARGETVKIPQSGLNPIDHALGLVGLKRSQLSRPLYHEEGYRMMCRIPLIDLVSKSPFYLHYWADKTSIEMQEAAEKGLYQTLAMMTKNINGGVNYELAESAHTFEGNLAEAYHLLCERHGAKPDQSVLETIENTNLAPTFSKKAGMLVFSLSEASYMAKQAFLKLNKTELSFLSERPERFFFPKDNQFNFLTAPTYVQEKVVAITRKIDFVKLFSSALLISDATDKFIAYLRNLDKPENPAHYFRDKVKRNGLLMDIPSPIGHILISGQDNDTHTRNGALLIDLGGNDRYTGSIAAGHLVPGRIAIAIDASGNDVYDAGKKPFSQGCGCLGVGILADLSGDDQYLAGDMAQACGMYGVGLLADLGGKDSYTMGMIGQGFGVFGLGLLQDASGDDTYIMSGLGQGTGSTMGHGCLCDMKGNDKYIANRNTRRGLLIPDEWCHVQGAGLSIRSPDWTNHFSIYGGIGLLTDKAGNDVYFASDGNCMGSSYFMSIGALVDDDGDDIYMPKNGNGLCYAVHLSNAVLIDRKGNDNYFGSTQTGGVGSDRSVAILVDYEGNDTYGPSEEYIREMILMKAAKKGEELSEVELKDRSRQKMADASFASSLKPKALGFLIDYRGNDRYFARHEGWVESCGGVLPPEEPQNWSHALLLDLGGRDFYYKDGRKDNHYFRYFKHGLSYDTEFTKTDLVGKAKFPSSAHKNYADENLFKNGGKGPEQEVVKTLFDPDLFVRYSAIGKIVQLGPKIISDLVTLLTDSVDIDFNLDLIEIINHFVIKHLLNQNHYQSIESLLKAKDPFVRGFAARVFGFQKVEGSLSALKKAIKDPDEAVRPYVVWALGRLGLHETIPLLADISINDPSSECRRYAVLALGALARKSGKLDINMEQRIMKTLFNTLKDEDESIRTAAASVLYSFNYPEVQTALEKRLKDKSVYVRRAASKSLILKGFKPAIAVLIESLNYPSRDTFENYDHELANDLAFYCGVDFAKEKRYAYNTWKNWWDTSGDSINLIKNLEIMKNIKIAFEVQMEDDGIAIFDQLIAENPNNTVIKKRYKRFCYEWITFRLLTREPITRKTFERCLRLQKIISELEPDNPQSKSKVAYFLARLSRFEEAVSEIKAALEIDPDNKQYRQALTQYTSLLKSRLKRSE
jgi:tetratricopeptide (TPR) repeat protein